MQASIILRKGRDSSNAKYQSFLQCKQENAVGMMHACLQKQACDILFVTTTLLLPLQERMVLYIDAVSGDASDGQVCKSQQRLLQSWQPVRAHDTENFCSLFGLLCSHRVTGNLLWQTSSQAFEELGCDNSAINMIGRGSDRLRKKQMLSLCCARCRRFLSKVASFKLLRVLEKV